MMIFSSSTELKRGQPPKKYVSRKVSIMDVSTHKSEKIVPKAFWFRPGIVCEVCTDSKKWSYRRKGKKGFYVSPYGLSLDTEFYTKVERDEKGKIMSARAYVYIWQICIDDTVILCRHLSMLKDCITEIINFFKLSEKRVMYMLIANSGCEFQFIRHYVNIFNGFMLDDRTPLSFCIENHGLIVYDACKISNMSLANIARNFCTTQKLVGEIDYCLPRHSLTPLTEKEISYCVNDVIILSEYYQYLKRLYIDSQIDIPRTSTGVIREAVRECFYSDTKKNSKIRDSVKLTQEMYDFIRGKCFQGGYTHSNCLKTGFVLEKVVGVDFTSSYPAVMLHEKFPMSAPVLYRGSFECFKEYLKGKKNFSWCCKLYMKKLKAKTCHSIIGVDKTEEFQKIKNLNKYVEQYHVTYDNGKILCADYATVYITNVDYEIYEKFYNFEIVKAETIYHMKNGFLPDYLLNPLKHFYKKKCVLKKLGKDKTPEYVMAKSIVNSAYGLCVQRVENSALMYDGSLKEVEKSFKEKMILSPMWGVWITAYARKNLLDMVYAIGSDVVYCDTDSIYMCNFEKHRQKIETWNRQIEDLNSKLDTIFSDIGAFDIIKDDTTGKQIFDKFKTLGAKRYIKSVGESVTVTIAGLPKGVLEKESSRKGIDIYDCFDDFMDISFMYSEKNAIKYNDTCHSDTYEDYMGVEYTMKSKSSMGIFPVSFNMKMNDLYKNLIFSIR